MEGRDQGSHNALSDEAQSPATAAAGEDSGASSAAFRYYDCVFCRRGFSTAQALGSHMNIHRRDRTRILPEAMPRRVVDGYHPYSREVARGGTPPEERLANYVVYFPEYSPFSGELERGREEAPPVGAAEAERENVEDLDLELRLGI